MAKRIEFKCGLYQRDTRYVVKSEVVLATAEDATAFATWLTEIVADYVRAKGGYVIELPGSQQPPKLEIPRN